MADDVAEIQALRDQLATWGALLTAPRVPKHNRKVLVRNFREAALAVADAAVEMARRHVAVVEENTLLRARLGDAPASDEGPML